MTNNILLKFAKIKPTPLKEDHYENNQHFAS